MPRAHPISSGETHLEKEMARLKAKLGLGGYLRVVWNPRHSIDGEHGLVRGSEIHIFDEDLEEAILTLRHELVEHVLTTEFLEPRIFEAKAHRRADALVDILARLL